eukprot:g5003.t1
MKFSTVAASLCVLGSASAFVFPMPVRSGATRVSMSLDEDEAAKTKAREALIGSASMEQLMKMVGGRDAEDEPEAPAPPAATPPPAAESS